ncbi:MAG: hypothetical protein ACFFCM_13330 [Promethearchaeota archaeon]
MLKLFETVYSTITPYLFLNAFRKNIEFSNPIIPNYGEFERTIVNDVHIGPKTQVAAQEWAMWLLERSITDYLFETNYMQIKENIIAKFPKFEISFPSREDFAKKLKARFKGVKEKPSIYWHVHTPIDLNRGGLIIE